MFEDGHRFSESDLDEADRYLLACLRGPLQRLAPALLTDIRRLRVALEEAEVRVMMGCEHPPVHCTCAGCLFADDEAKRVMAEERSKGV